MQQWVCGSVWVCLGLLIHAGATLKSNSSGDMPDMFGEDPSQTKINDLTKIAFGMIGLAGKGKLEKRNAFDFLHHKGKTQRSLWELLGARQWDYSEWPWRLF